jgi:hypothetical protein
VDVSVRPVAMTFLVHLIGHYKTQVDEGGAKSKQKEKARRNRVGERVKNKWERRVEGAPLLEKHEAIKGRNLVRFVQRGFMSPDVSDCGDAPQDEWEAARAKANAGSHGLERRRVSFRATWVSNS